MDTIINIETIFSSDKVLIYPKSITISKILIGEIIIRMNTTNKIFLVKDLINCDALELVFLTRSS
jgi:hypothetical protein